MPDAVDELDRSKRPAVTLVSAWVSQVARDARIDTALLATRADLVAILRGDPDARLAHGWRAELLGDGLTRLMEGRAGLTFDGKGSLSSIDVANRPDRAASDYDARQPGGARFPQLVEGVDDVGGAARRRRGSGGARRGPG